VRAFWELTYVPAEVYMTAVAGAHVLRSVKAGKVGEDPYVVGGYLGCACRAGLDLPVIRGLAEKCGKWDIEMAAEYAAEGGHADVLDLLASEFGARVGVKCLKTAARWGHIAMTDHLVEEYGVDPNGTGEDNGWTALHEAAWVGRVRTVKHLVEKHKVDIHKRKQGNIENDEPTALDLAEDNGKTACADYLRELTYTQLLAGEYRGDIDVKLFLSAARRVDDAMIDLLVERYGVDPNAGDKYGLTALHWAAWEGRVRTVKHLVEKHNVDIHERLRNGQTALDLAESDGRTACAAYLRALQSTRPPPS
jgi:ankyrin repeat protein